MTSGNPTAARSMSLPRAFRWPITLVLGAVAVAVSAQFSVPLPFTPVPMTLQGLAVILVGGLTGSAAGAGAMLLYLTAGAFGAPVFANGSGGLHHLLGPTGGYLLAFPLAAWIVGWVGQRRNLGLCLLAALLGMVAIHAGGLAQLAPTHRIDQDGRRRRHRALPPGRLTEGGSGWIAALAGAPLTTPAGVTEPLPESRPPSRLRVAGWAVLS